MSGMYSKNYKFSQLENADYFQKIEMYNDRIYHWLFEPIKVLLSNDVNFMVSAFALELTYFEHIAQFFYGEDSNGQSKEYFNKGSKLVMPNIYEQLEKLSNPEFNHSDVSRKFHEDSLTALNKDFYSFARCGLFHDANIRDNFTLTNSTSSFFGIEEVGGKHRMDFNPYEVHKKIVSYHDSYITSLKNNEQPVSSNFEKIFDKRWKID